MSISQTIASFVNKRQLVIQLLQRYFGFHVLVEFLPRLFFVRDLYQSDGVSGITSQEALRESFYGIPTHYVQDWAHITILVVCIAGVYLLFIGPRFWLFAILLIGIESLSYLNNWILDGGDNWLKFLLIYFFFYSFSIDAFHFINRENWRRILSEIKAISGVNIAVHFTLIYLISGLAKSRAEVWHEGVALYYILAGTRFCLSEFFHELMKVPLFVVTATYATIIWEVLMPFLVWFKPYKYYMIGLGVIFHLSVFSIMMLGGFQLLYIATLIIYFEDRELLGAARLIWDKCGQLVSRQLRKGCSDATSN